MRNLCSKCNGQGIIKVLMKEDGQIRDLECDECHGYGDFEDE